MNLTWYALLTTFVHKAGSSECSDSECSDSVIIMVHTLPGGWWEVVSYPGTNPVWHLGPLPGGGGGLRPDQVGRWCQSEGAAHRLEGNAAIDRLEEGASRSLMKFSMDERKVLHLGQTSETTSSLLCPALESPAQERLTNWHRFSRGPPGWLRAGALALRELDLSSLEKMGLRGHLIVACQYFWRGYWEDGALLLSMEEAWGHILKQERFRLNRREKNWQWG